VDIVNEHHSLLAHQLSWLYEDGIDLEYMDLSQHQNDNENKFIAFAKEMTESI
jgi:hypothetical protein